MTWYKVDDGFWAHPKTLLISDSAIALWLKAGTWASQMLTDGLVPSGSLGLFGSGEAVAAELVDVGLWEPDPKGYRFHDWDHYQPSAEVEKAKRAARSEAGRKGAEARWGGKTDGKSHGNSDGKTYGKTDAPSRPVPSRNSPSNDGESVAAKRGSRLTAGWMPAQATIDKIKADYPALDLKAEHEAFTDYWIAQPGQRGVKLDWDATWRNWMRNTAKRARPAKPTPTERAMQTAQAGRQVAGRLVTSLDPKELT